MNYQYFSFYQNLLYSTESVKNRFNTTGKNLYELNLLQELAIFNVKREENKIGNILKKFYKTINLSCENFYYSINDQRINIMEEENPNDFFTQKFPDVRDIFSKFRIVSSECIVDVVVDFLPLVYITLILVLVNLLVTVI